jgi:hypothetical protein
MRIYRRALATEKSFGREHPSVARDLSVWARLFIDASMSGCSLPGKFVLMANVRWKIASAFKRSEGVVRKVNHSARCIRAAAWEP